MDITLTWSKSNLWLQKHGQLAWWWWYDEVTQEEPDWLTGEAANHSMRLIQLVAEFRQSIDAMIWTPGACSAKAQSCCLKHSWRVSRRWCVCSGMFLLNRCQKRWINRQMDLLRHADEQIFDLTVGPEELLALEAQWALYTLTLKKIHERALFTHVLITGFSDAFTHCQTLHTNPRIAHKMQNASHLVQNGALRSKYHKQ